MIEQTTIVPFSKNNLALDLLKCIFKALRICHDNWVLNKITEAKDLKDCFEKFIKHSEHKKTGTNEYLKVGHNKKKDFNSRLAQITINSFTKIKEGSTKSSGITLPSPLYILYQMLTVPDEPYSSNYALHFCRTFLFEKFGVYPEHPFKPSGFKNFNVSDVSQVLFTFHSHISEGNNLTKTYDNPLFLLLAHYLALKGFFYLRFPADKNPKKPKELLKTSEILNHYFDDFDVDGLRENMVDKMKEKERIEFHLLDIFNSIPDTATIINELSGILIPIRGFDTVFQGGLSTDSSSSIVLRVSGKPGSGKTSFALAIAAALSPFGTYTYYVSIEEKKSDLTNRLYTLIPGYLKKMSIFNNDIDDWFGAENVPLEDQQNLEKVQKEFVESVRDRIARIRQRQDNKKLPAMCPLVVVIDSIRFFEEQYLSDGKPDRQKLIEFIDQCRRLQCMVILLSGEDEKINREIDYLVDVVITFHHEQTGGGEKPYRLFELTKTRHQMSRPGAHIFHLSGENGFRLSPQLSSQLDKKDIQKRQLASKIKGVLTFANLWNGLKPLIIGDQSQILVEGLGSSGKAGLSLNILYTPILDFTLSKKNQIESLKLDPIALKRKVLIISFLYPEEYYISLKDDIVRNLKENNFYKNLTGEIDCLYLFSGFLRPEDLVSKVLRKLERGILDGNPFTGVLIDGLHNISLGFHRIQDSDLIWPTLYTLLLKYKVTLVTTFTRFMINSNSNHLPHIDREIMLKGQYPLLHTLVQATDYHFNVEPSETAKDTRKTQGRYTVNLMSAINHPLTGEKFIWDREAKKILKHPEADIVELPFIEFK